MFVVIKTCLGVAPVIATSVPSTYSLFVSAARSSARYSSAVRNGTGSEAIAHSRGVLAKVYRPRVRAIRDRHGDRLSPISECRFKVCTCWVKRSWGGGGGGAVGSTQGGGGCASRWRTRWTSICAVG